MEHDASREYLTVAAAARRLGISDAAVRQRIKRGSLRSQKLNRTVYVLFDPDGTPDASPPVPYVATPAVASQLPALLDDAYAQHLAPLLEHNQRLSEELGRLRAEYDALVVEQARPRRRWWRFWS